MQEHYLAMTAVYDDKGEKMLCIRVADEVVMTTGADSEFKLSEVPRKGMMALGASVNDNHIVFADTILNQKMIPRAEAEAASRLPVKVIATSSSGPLVFQDIGCVSFLRLDEDTGLIERVRFQDICPGDDSILCYDGAGDWDIEEVIVAYEITGVDADGEVDAGLEAEAVKAVASLSEYVVFDNSSGLIMNGIIVC